MVDKWLPLLSISVNGSYVIEKKMKIALDASLLYL